MNNKRLLRWQSNPLGILMTTVLLLALAALQFQPALAGGVTPKFEPSNPRLHGRSIIERWRCVRDLPGDIILLADTTGATSGVQNKCVVLMGTALYFPIQNTCRTAPVESAPPEQGATHSDTGSAGSRNIRSEEAAVDASTAKPENYPFPIPFDPGSADITPVNPDETCRVRPPVACYPKDGGSTNPEDRWADEMPLSPGLEGVKVR